MAKTAQLLYACPETDADLLYLSQFFAPDPFIWWRVNGVRHAVLSPLEIDRGRAAAGIDQVHEPEEFLPKSTRQKSPDAVIAGIKRAQGITRFEVPATTPAGLIEALRRRKVAVSVKKGSFCPEREIKTAEEVKLIMAAQRKGEAGLRRGLEVLKQSAIKPNGVLFWQGRRLTSEILRGEMDAEVVRRGGLPANTIVAGGNQACDPHERGHGPLRAHETIILDIFPRDQGSGYHGDLTRTVVRGRASDAARNLYATVAEGKRWALSQMKAGADGKKIHRELVKRFERKGWKTEQRDGRWVGFFHGTGHSLGLEVHEPPRFSAGKFKAGHIQTVEPGLYYPGIGAVRLEDLVVVTKTGVSNLTKMAQRLEI
ncbi:MAG: Xaa-Pro peptidase family protein [Verrucomicrobiota bacterium]